MIGIASMTSLFGNETVPGYGAAKAGLTQLTKTLAIAWAPDNIRVNAVAAGLIETGMTKAMMAADAHKPFVAHTDGARRHAGRRRGRGIVSHERRRRVHHRTDALPADGYSIRG